MSESDFTNEVVEHAQSSPVLAHSGGWLQFADGTPALTAMRWRYQRSFVVSDEMRAYDKMIVQISGCEAYCTAGTFRN
jgi:hypothetical protein